MPPRDVFAGPERPVLAVDNGSGLLKCGFAGEEEPRSVLPTRGLPEAGGEQGPRPLERGVVADWEAMETYWDVAWTQQLQVDTERCDVVITVNLFESKDNKERLMQSLFESFAFHGVFCSAPPVFELYAAGRENGVVLGSGAQCTYAVLVHEGLPDPRTMLRSAVAGEPLDSWASRTLRSVAGGELSEAEACAAKEAVGRVAEMDGAKPDAEPAQQFTLPDGRSLSVPMESCVQLGEPLFSPGLLGEASGGVAQLVSDCIGLKDRDGVFDEDADGPKGTPAWFGNIVVAGGSTCFPGFDARLQRELAARAPKGASVSLVSPPERKHAAWLGASILGSLGVMNQMWITKEEYDENGPLIVHRKCF